jgi:hypothetical protein
VVASEQSGDVRSARVLIPLNVEWDTAALGRHVAFDDTVDWLTTTVRTVLDATAESDDVIVRQHPSERRPGQRSRLDLEGILGAHFGDDSRYSFVSATDPISSYDLLRSAEVVLPFTSNIGIEAAALGKTVLVAGSSFYAALGFTWSARSRDEYLLALRRALAGDLPPLADQQERAWLCYYLVAVRNRVWTEFTSVPADFAKWVRRSPSELFRDPEVADVLAALDDDIPVSLLRHERARAAGEWWATRLGRARAGSGRREAASGSTRRLGSAPVPTRRTRAPSRHRSLRDETIVLRVRPFCSSTTAAIRTTSARLCWWTA